MVRDVTIDIFQDRLIRQCCREVAGIEGDAVEIGVHRGETAKLICQLLPDSTVYLFDTFYGMPREMITVGVDYHREKDFGDTSLKDVADYLKPEANATIVPGTFPQSAEVSPRIRFAHIDVDLYLSTIAALKWCWPLLVPGGVILNDDYGCGSCRGAKKAVDEFVEDYGASCEVKLDRAIIRRLDNGN